MSIVELPDRRSALPYKCLSTPVWIFDVERHAIWWANRSALAFWRAESLDELLARDFSGDTEMVRRRLRQTLKHTEPGGFAQDVWTLYPGGEPTTVKVSLAPARIDGGRQALVLQASPAIDLGEDPEALRMLEATRYTSLMVSTVALDGRILSCNPAAVQTYGPHGAAGEGDAAAHIGARLISLEALSALFNEGGAGLPYNDDIEVETRNGRRWHRMDARRARDPVTGAPVIVITEEDVTDRIQSARQLAEMNRHLEERVRARTRELEEKSASLEATTVQALEARREAEAATRAKSIFLANMSHELRTPLNAILGFSEIMTGRIFGALAEPYRDYAQDINRSAHHLLSLINDLLDLSRVEAGELKLNETCFDPVEAVEAAVALIHGAYESHGVSLTVNLPPLPELYADARAVQQVVLNLLSNAVKASDGDGVVEVSGGLRDGGLEIVVRDEGCGIAPDDIPVVLMPYGQSSGAPTRGAEGTGLGLPIAKAMMESHGGSLEIASAIGQGTRVTIRFPGARLQTARTALG